MNTFRLSIVLASLSLGSAVYAQTVNAAAAPAPEERGKVDINTADIPTLESVPEIGTNFANAVVAGRPYKTVQDLERVLKIGPEKMASLQRRVTASPVKSPAPKGPDTPPFKGPKPPAVNEGKAIDGKVVEERYDRANQDRSAPRNTDRKK